MPKVSRKQGEVRLSIRIPKYQHTWIKKRSESTKVCGQYESMNDIIQEAIDDFMGV